MGRDWNPNTASWLVVQRGSRKQDDIVAELRARGQRIDRSWLSRIENGAPFSDALLAAFIDLYGSVPPPYEPKEKGEAPEDLASAIREQSRAIGAQTVAINDLVNELRELALRAPSAGPTVDELEAQMRALRTEVRLHHSEPDGAARPARSAPLESER